MNQSAPIPGNDDIIDINKLAVAKVKCLKSLLFSSRYFFKHTNKTKLVIGDPHRIICEALERVLRGECKRLIINIAPRYGKTEFAVKQFIAHGLALNPASKYIHLSYSDDLALDNSERIKDVVASHEYRQLFPSVEIKHGSDAKNKWYTTAGGGVLARAAGGSVTGFGAGQTDGEPDTDDIDEFINDIAAAQQPDDPLDKKMKFGGAIIIDDPIKPEDADSETIRERVNSRFDSTIRNRVNSRNTPIIIIMQRLHPNDLCGYLQRKDEADDWEVISLPSINQVALPVPGQKNDDGTQRCLKIGDALLPWKHTKDELKKLEKSNELVFGRQHMQDPSPKSGLLFPKQEISFYNHAEMWEKLDNADFVYVCADPANLGGDDFASGVFKLIGNKIYVTDIAFNTFGTDVNEPIVRDFCLKNRAGECGVEGIMSWKETAERIRGFLHDRDYQGEFRLLRPRTNKHSRILNRASFIKNNFVFRDDWEDMDEYAKFMRNLTSYMRIQQPGAANKHDDAPDLCEMAGVYYERNHGHVWENAG